MYSAGSEDIFNYVPKKLLPVEIGGFGESHNHFNGTYTFNIV